MVLRAVPGAGLPILDSASNNRINELHAKLMADALDALPYTPDSVALASSLFGSGIDGDATAVGTLTLTTDKFYQNLTVPVGTILDVSAGVRVFVNGTLTLLGTVRSLGVDGGSGVIDVGGPGGGSAEDGATGVLGAGSNASPGFPGFQPSVGGDGGGSGTAGTGDGGAGGPNLSAIISNLLGSYNGPVASAVVADGYGQNGQGGSSGGGDGVAFNGGGGGGGGGGAKGIIIFANTLVMDVTSTLLTVGGNGGNGGVPGGGNTGGGSGGGGGGTAGILLVTNIQSGAFGTLTRTPGTGGAGGTAGGTGTPGNAGQAGGIGKLVIHQLSAGTNVVV